MHQHPLHLKALELAKDYKRIESELIGVIQEIDAFKLFRRMGFASLFDYVNRGLALSESTTYALIAVARKSAQIPELKTAIDQGGLTVSQAKRITAVITPTNAPLLIEKAKSLTQRELEREVAKINPQPITKERARFLTEDRMELKLSVSEKLMKDLRRIQDLESQRTSKASTLEDCLIVMTEIYLSAKDPLRKSERALPRPSSRKVLSGVGDQKTYRAPSKIGPTNREDESIAKRSRYIPSSIRHQVILRDQNRCTYIDPKGSRCVRQRWLDIHHKRPFRGGGTHDLENLATLCSAHHHTHHLELQER